MARNTPTLVLLALFLAVVLAAPLNGMVLCFETGENGHLSLEVDGCTPRLACAAEGEHECDTVASTGDDCDDCFDIPVVGAEGDLAAARTEGIVLAASRRVTTTTRSGPPKFVLSAERFDPFSTCAPGRSLPLLT